MEEQQRSKVLLTGPLLETLRVLKILHAAYGATKGTPNPAIDAFIQQILDSPADPVEERVFPDHFEVTNKYFSAAFDIVLLSPPSGEETLLEKYEGLISIVPSGETTKAIGWTVSGPLEPLSLRITLLSRPTAAPLGDSFMESHFDSLSTYTETLSVYLGTEEVLSPEEYAEHDADGIGRLLEGLSEVMWKGYVEAQRPKKPAPSHRLAQALGIKEEQENTGLKVVSAPEGYAKMAGDEDEEVPAPHFAVAANTSTDQANTKSALEADPVEQEMKDSMEFDDEMKIFEEILAFKNASVGMSSDMRKLNADKLFSKLIDKYGDF